MPKTKSKKVAVKKVKKGKRKTKKIGGAVFHSLPFLPKLDKRIMGAGLLNQLAGALAVMKHMPSAVIKATKS